MLFNGSLAVAKFDKYYRSSPHRSPGMITEIRKKFHSRLRDSNPPPHNWKKIKISPFGATLLSTYE
jgi:hypothetical protein